MPKYSAHIEVMDDIYRSASSNVDDTLDALKITLDLKKELCSKYIKGEMTESQKENFILVINNINESIKALLGI